VVPSVMSVILQRPTPCYTDKRAWASHAVCAVELVDGAQQINGSRGMNAPKKRASALQMGKNPKLAEKRANCRGFHEIR